MIQMNLESPSKKRKLLNQKTKKKNIDEDESYYFSSSNSQASANDKTSIRKHESEPTGLSPMPFKEFTQVPQRFNF